MTTMMWAMQIGLNYEDFVPPFPVCTPGSVSFLPTQAGFCPANNCARVGPDPRRAGAIWQNYEVVVGPVGFGVGPGAVRVHRVCTRHRDAGKHIAVHARGIGCYRV